MKRFFYAGISFLILLIGILFIYCSNKKINNNNITLEFQNYNNIDNFKKIPYSGNIIFSKMNINDQIIIISTYEEYKKFQKEYINEMWNNGTSIENGFANELKNAQYEFEDNMVAIVIFYNEIQSYGINLYINGNSLYLVSLKNYPLTLQFNNNELNSYNSKAYILFIEKEIINNINKLIIDDKNKLT